MVRASLLAGTRETFCVKLSKIGAKRTCIDIRGVVVKLSGLSAMPYSMASLLKNFQFSKPNHPLTFPVRQTFSISDRPLMHEKHDVSPRLISYWQFNYYAN